MHLTKIMKENLFIQFTVASFVVLAVVAAALTLSLSNTVRVNAIRAATDETVAENRAPILAHITAADLATPMTGERYTQFNKFVQESIVSDLTAQVKLWGADSTVIYSTDQGLVGARFADDENVAKALRGETTAEIPSSAKLAKEGETPEALIEVYTPIVFSGNSEPQGVIEIYTYYKPTADLISELRRQLFVIIGIGFVVLYGALVSGVWRGWRTLVRQRREREQAEELFRTMSDSSPVGIFIVADGKFQFVNPQFEKYTGYSRDQLLGTGLLAIVLPEDRDLVRENAVKMLKEQRSATYEYRLVNALGETKWAMETLVSIDYQGKQATLGNCVDITERKRTEQELRRQTAFMQLLQKVAVAANESLNVEDAMQFAIDQVCSHTRWPIGHVYLRDSTGELAPTIMWHLGKARQFETFRKASETTRFDLGVGLPGHVLTTEKPVWNIDVTRDPNFLRAKAAQESGIKAGFALPVLVGREIVAVLEFFTTEPLEPDGILLEVMGQIGTQLGRVIERNQAEEKLRESEERYRSLFENTLDMVQSVAPGGRILFVNRAWRETLGYTEAEVPGLNLFKIIHPNSLAHCQELFAKVMRGDSIQNIQATFITKDGREILVEGNATPRYVGGNVIAAQGILRNVTERKKMEEQLMAQDRLASIGQLASGVAHEMNNPLTGVIAFSEMLMKRTDLPDDAKEDLKIVNDEAQRTARVVKGLLTFARKQGTEKALVDINSIIQGVLQLRSYEQRVSSIEISTRFAPDLPQIIGNSGQLQQVLMNIVINAEQAMLEAHGRGKLAITTEQVGDMVLVSVTDDGPGISPENMRKLFTPFFTTKEVGKGTGLGLSICHGIVTEHGGKIHAESEPGKGATFIVELPISR